MLNQIIGDDFMANSIQAIRNVYDIAKGARDNESPMSDEEIVKLLERTVSDKSLIPKYHRFEKGYAAEDLFMRIFSLLPWVKTVVPLGQEQFPEKSKEELQVPDYEITFEAGSETNTSCVLIEVKLVDGDKQTHELQKYKYDVLKKYSCQKNEPLLFGIFWRKQGVWTINSIESFAEKSSAYKISYENACLDDLSAIFGDYTYLFRRQCYRKSKFSQKEDIKTDFIHIHEKYGRTVYEGLSLDGKSFEPLCMLEPPVLDCAFDFNEISCNKLSETDIELIEKYIRIPYVYKLSSLILAYLLKIYCFDKNDMYYKNNIVVENSFGIVDTVRRKCGGEKFYLMPYNINKMATQMIELQFGQVNHIMEAYKNAPRENGDRIIVSHEYGLNYQKTGKELMSQDEIAVMDGGKCIMQLRGVRPFFSDKFDITKHKRYKELSDFDPKNAFDIEDYVKHLHRMKVTPDTEVDDAFDCGEVEGDTTK